MSRPRVWVRRRTSITWKKDTTETLADTIKAMYRLLHFKTEFGNTA